MLTRRTLLKTAAAASLAAALRPLGSKPARAAGNMKFYAQWAKTTPGDWSLSDGGLWTTSQTKDEPVGDVSLAGLAIGDALLNNSPGWVFGLNVQGVIFEWYDHYHVEDLTDGSLGTRVTAWRDDPILFPSGTRQADVALFLPLAFDPRVGGTNTRQTFTFYREGAEYDPARHQPYADFVPPVTNVKHGIYVSDAKWDEHQAARTERGWRDWLVADQTAPEAAVTVRLVDERPPSQRYA